MRKFVQVSLAALVLSLAFTGSAALADNPTSPAAGTKSTAPAAKAPAALTFESLGEMLTNMGFDPQAKEYSNGHPYYLLNVETGDFSVTASVAISNSGSVIWISANLTNLPDQMTVDPLLKVLESVNKLSGKAQLRKTGNSIFIEYPIDNRNVTASVLRNELTEFGLSINATAPVCDTTKWPTTDSKPLAAKPALEQTSQR